MQNYNTKNKLGKNLSIFQATLGESKNKSKTKFLYIPQSVEKTMTLNKFDKVEVQISRIVRQLKCKVCQNIFDSEDELPECNICDSTNLVEVQE